MIVTIRPIDIKTSKWQDYLACGDHHLGNIGSDVKHIKRDLAEAKRRNARILIDGDVFDCIYPRDSRRYNPAIIIPELRDRADPINATVGYGFGIFRDYAEQIDMIGLGNHESATMHTAWWATWKPTTRISSTVTYRPMLWTLPYGVHCEAKETFP